MTPRPAHQPIDGLADKLEQRAEVEGLARGFSINVRRALVLWAIRWACGLAAAIWIGRTVEWLAWLPAATAAVALVSLGSIFLIRARVNRRILATRARLDQLERTLRVAERATTRSGGDP